MSKSSGVLSLLLVVVVAGLIEPCLPLQTFWSIQLPDASAILSMAVDETGLYVLGEVGYGEWALDKRSKFDGSRVWSVGRSTGQASPVSVAADGRLVYLLTAGSLGGWMIDALNPFIGTHEWEASGSTISGTPRGASANVEGVYLALSDRAPGDAMWLMLKLDASTAALQWVAASNPSSLDDHPTSAAAIADAIYSCGFTREKPEPTWRAEKRLPSDGSLLWSRTGSSPVSDQPPELAADASGAYVLTTSREGVVRVTKLCSSDGSVNWTRALHGGEAAGTHRAISLSDESVHVFSTCTSPVEGIRVDRLRKDSGSLDGSNFIATPAGRVRSVCWKETVYVAYSGSGKTTLLSLPSGGPSAELRLLDPAYRAGTVRVIAPSRRAPKPLACQPAAPSDYVAAFEPLSELNGYYVGNDTDPRYVNQATGEPEGYSGDRVFTVGGPLVNPVTRRYENPPPGATPAPLRYRETADAHAFETPGGRVITASRKPKIAINDYTDTFLIETFTDEDGRWLLVAYGYGAHGTTAASLYLKHEVLRRPWEQKGQWLVAQWIDADLDGAVDPPGEDEYRVLARDS